MLKLVRGLLTGLVAVCCLDARAAGSRDDEPVVIPGAALADLAGVDVHDLDVFVWGGNAGGYVPIPFQVDERILASFNEGTPYPFSQTMYDVEGRDDGLLDADDEVVFMYRDAGQTPAPAAAPWPAGAGDVSYEIAVQDPRGGGSPRRYVYVFSGAGLARSPVAYVAWAGSEDRPVASELFEVGFAGRWLVNTLRVFSPCGAGVDLIDRVKGRAEPLPTRAEDEDGWNTNSTWLGGLVGPVRAIRYVRGANSALNTIMHDVVYRNLWERTVDLRVHPLPSARLYIDWLPGSGRTEFLSTARGGVTVDGNPDSVPQTLLSWSIMRTPAGGGAVLYTVPATPLVAQRLTYYRDDRNFDDRIEENPGYADDDDAAYGATGVQLSGVGDSQIAPILLQFRLYPLCANDGSAALGDTLTEILSSPLQVQSVARFASISPIRSLAVSRAGADVRLGWSAVTGAQSYRVFASPDPALPPAAWTLLGTTPAPPFTDGGAAALPGARCYSVVAVIDGEQGGW
jgi:hypothetical protein